MLTLSQDAKTLYYINMHAKSCLEKVRGPGKVKMSELLGISYGGQTATFERLQNIIVRMHAQERLGVQSVLPHYDERR